MLTISIQQRHYYLRGYSQLAKYFHWHECQELLSLYPPSLAHRLIIVDKDLHWWCTDWLLLRGVPSVTRLYPIQLASNDEFCEEFLFFFCPIPVHPTYEQFILFAPSETGGFSKPQKWEFIEFFNMKPIKSNYSFCSCRGGFHKPIAADICYSLQL